MVPEHGSRKVAGRYDRNRKEIISNKGYHYDNYINCNVFGESSKIGEQTQLISSHQ